MWKLTCLIPAEVCTLLLVWCKLRQQCVLGSLQPDLVALVRNACWEAEDAIWKVKRQDAGQKLHLWLMELVGPLLGHRDDCLEEGWGAASPAVRTTC